ncbi:hypothetical protein KAU15_01350, partial [candidate division WOR-3 bacterium]|nr:hypothetical protein [candidate division WOR-3 bacterium]
MNDFFYTGENSIEIYSENIQEEKTGDRIRIYIPGGPEIVTTSPLDNNILNEIDETLDIYKSIEFEEDAKLSLDSIVDYVYKLPVSTLEMQEDSFKRFNIGNDELICTDTFEISDIEEGRYEIFSLGYYIDSVPPTSEYTVFYIDTTPPTVTIVNYTPSEKYSIRNQGFLKFQYIPEDNFKYFFPFYEKGIVRIYDSYDDIKDTCILDMGTFGGVNYASFYYDSADIANFPDGDYYAEITITDKAGLDGFDTVEFIVDNTPPEITIVEDFDNNIFNMYDISKEIVINVNEKCNVSILFENIENGLSISNDAYCDTLQFEFVYNDSTETLDSVPTEDIKIFAGSFGTNIYLPDGRYQVDMIGTDEVKNDITILLFDEFIVDRTPPVIENPVCMPLVVNSDEQITVFFTLSEDNDTTINKGTVTYTIRLNGKDSINGSEEFPDGNNHTEESITITDDIPNGINNIEIIATDQHGNKSYGYAQFINKTIGTYISQPIEGDTIYLGIANIIEGIANDPDMSNMKPFEKYALYWIDSSIAVIPALRSKLTSLNTTGMITPISNRNETVSENESVVFCEYIENLGVYTPTQIGEQTILLASFEEGSDIISCDIKSLEVVDGSGIAIPEITYMNLGKAINSSENSFNVENDSMYIRRQFKNKVSDVIIDIINENGISVYENTSNNIIPLWGEPIFSQADPLEGVFIWTVNDSFFIEICTPEDENMKSIVITSLNGYEIFSDTTDTMVSIMNNQLLISGKIWNKRIIFECEDENIEFMVSPEYYNVYTGSGLAEAPNSFEYSKMDYKVWDFKDKFGRYTSSGDYSIHLTVVGTDGVGLDTEIMNCEIINPLTETITIIPDTINVLNPMKDYFEVNTTLNQSGYVKHNLEIINKENISREITTDTIALNYQFQNTYRYSDFSIDDSILNCEVIVYNAELTDSVISNDTIPFSNMSVSVINEGLFIPKEYCTSSDTTAEIYDGKGEFLYSFDANGGIYLPREVSYDIDVNAQKLMKDVSVIAEMYGYGKWFTGSIDIPGNPPYNNSDIYSHFVTQTNVQYLKLLENNDTWLHIFHWYDGEEVFIDSVDITDYIKDDYKRVEIKRESYLVGGCKTTFLLWEINNPNPIIIYSNISTDIYPWTTHYAI